MKMTRSILAVVLMHAVLAPPVSAAIRNTKSVRETPQQQTLPRQATTPPSSTPTPQTSSAASPSPTPTVTPQQRESASVNADDDVVQITTNLVQFDAVVTDRKGQQVTDLRAEDFEIFENDEPQQITNFSYVSNVPADSVTNVAPSSPSPPDNRKNKLAPPVPPARLRPEQVRRTIALVVDDLGLSFESTYYVRQALKKYVDEQMGANDLVAIIRTSAGVGALQGFTADRRQLYAAIERVRWYPSGRGGIGAFAPLSSIDTALDNAQRNAATGDSDADISRRNGDREDLDTFREELFTVGTLGALNFVIRGLRELPGRKAVVLFSDGLRLFNRASSEDGGGYEASTRILDAMRRLTDLANRASVVFYTLDARGLQVLGLTAADDTNGLTPTQLENRLTDRRNDFFDTQTGLIYLAQQTGGVAVRNNNDLNGGIRRVLEDQKGFYLIGYRPDERTFDPATGRRRFNKFSIKIRNRSDLRVRTRSGFFGVTTENARPVRRTRSEQMSAAISSPFTTNDVGVRLTSLFGNEQQSGSFVRSLLHIDGRNLTFTKDADGWQKCVIDVVALTYGDNGRVINEVNRTETLRARDEGYDGVLRDGIIYSINVPVKKAGAYQLRVAVRDAATERVGSASQFVEIPNFDKKRFALSSIAVQGVQPSAAGASQTANAPTDEATKKPDAFADERKAQASPAVRRLRPGMILEFGYQIYNARLDRATNQPQLQLQTRLFRDGKQIYLSKETPFDSTGQTDLRRLVSGGRLQLGAMMQPGEYILQVVATDLLAKEKQRTTTNFIDFEIIK